MRSCWLILPLLAACIEQPEPQFLPSSCQEILADDPEAPDGVHALVRRTKKGTVSRRVYCDMTTDSGGWMLVGRSVAGADPSDHFGWLEATGFLSEDATNADLEPYSLDTTGLAFTEILVGSYTTGYALDIAYKIEVPENYLTAYPESAYDATRDGEIEIVTVLGTCDQPQMFSWAGITAETEVFYFRDGEAELSENLHFGLNPDGFNTNYDDCRGGDVNGEQGMVFVR